MSSRVAFWDLPPEDLDFLSSLTDLIAKAYASILDIPVDVPIEAALDKTSPYHAVPEEGVLKRLHAINHRLEISREDHWVPLSIRPEDLTSDELTCLVRAMDRWLRSAARATLMTTLMTNLVWSARNARRIQMATDARARMEERSHPCKS